jgi:hypothetical protein
MSGVGIDIGTHDIVTLINPVNEWSAGTEGAVVDDLGPCISIEFMDSRGKSDGPISVDPEQVRIARKASTPPVIGVLDQVALLRDVPGWRIGTTGSVVAVSAGRVTVEIYGYFGASLDFVDLPLESFRLICKCPNPDLDFAKSRAVIGYEKRAIPMGIGEHDVVELLAPFEGWPVGMRGTVVIDAPDCKAVEISNHRGETLAILDVPTEQLRLNWKLPSVPGESDVLDAPGD